MTNDEIRQLPPTPENLERIGWDRTDTYLSTPLGHESCFVYAVVDMDDWMIMRGTSEIDIPAPATMGDVLEWHRLLKIPVKEIT